MNKESNVFLEYLQLENIQLDEREFDFQVETHPEFPSLLAFHDALNFFKIPNIAVRIEDKNVNDLPDHFIAQINTSEGSELALVQQKEHKFHIKLKEKKNLLWELEEFQKAWSGIVLAAESDEVQTVQKNSKDLTFAILGILGIIGMVFISIPLAIFFVFILAGIFFGKEAVSQELSIDTNFSSKFCNISAQTDCNTVIQSEGFKLFGKVGLSDFSILYFSGQLIAFSALLLKQQESDFFLFSLGLSVVIVPLTLGSIYYQWRVIKKWCMVCLAIIALLYIQSAYSFWYIESYQLTFEFQTTSLILYGSSFVLVTLVWLSIKPFLNRYFELEEENKQLFKFKRNYPLFKKELLSQKKIIYSELPAHFIVGNPDARLKMSIVTNPFCKYCKAAHFEFEKLLEQYPDKICLNILFFFNPDTENGDSSKGLHLRLADIYMKDGGQKLMDALGDWFSHKEYDRWIVKYGEFSGEIDTLRDIFYTQNTCHQKNNILFTPTVTLGNYQYPSAYENSDIALFAQDLLADPQIIL